MKKIFRVDFFRHQGAWCYVAASNREEAWDIAEERMKEKDNRIIPEPNFSDWEIMESNEVSGVSEDEAIRINALYIEDEDSVGFTDTCGLPNESDGEETFDTILKKAVHNRVVYQPQNGIYLSEESYSNPLVHACCGSHSGRHRRHCQTPEALASRQKQSEQASRYHKSKTL